MGNDIEYKYKQRQQRGKTVYQKTWTDPETGKTKTKNITDQEYFDHLKAEAAKEKAKPEQPETVKPEVVEEVPEDVVTVDPKTGRRSKSQTVPDGKPVVEEDGEITEILGRITKVKITEDKDGGNRQFYFDVTDLNGKTWNGLYVNTKVLRGSVRWIMKHIAGNQNDQFEAAMETPRDELQKQVTANMDYQPIRLFRCLFDPETGRNDIFANVSLSWQKIKIKDLMPTIKEVFADTPNAIIKPEIETNGKHGGRCTVAVPGLSDLFDLNFTINAGQLDGYHSAKVSAGCTILYCLNQLTFPSNAIPDLENVFNFHKRQVHAGQKDNFKENLEGTFTQAKEDIFGMLEASKKAKLTKQQQQDILTYFVARGRLSNTDYEEMVKLLTDKEIAQVPNTMYGVAMVVSYRGTHHEKLTDRKRGRLAVVAGELFIVSKAKDAYLDLIAPVVDAYREEQKRKEEERKAKAEEAKKAAEERQAEREAEAEQ